MYGQWKVILEPEGKNDYERNEGGMIVKLANSSYSGSTQEVSRVAFVRRNSANPHASYEHQLKLEVEKARASVKILNESHGGLS